MIPYSRDAFQLMMDGAELFADMEENGFKIDVEYLKRVDKEVAEKVASIEAELKADGLWAEWQKRHGVNADFGKREQMADIVYNVLKVPPKRITKSGKESTDAEAFDGIEHPFVKKWGSVMKLNNVRAVNISGVLREVADGVLHPSLSQHLALTYRSSCADPNGHAIPNRDKRIAAIVRRGFVPRPEENVLIETDFSGAEVRAACPYHKDPVMLRYIREDHDLHFDMAMECFKLEKGQVSKGIRGAAKGMFVFAAFYGDWFLAICQNLWAAVDGDRLTLKDGTPLRDHLNRVGLRELGGLDARNPVPGSFEAHIKEVERRFWFDRFKVYSEWKERHWNDYLSKGWFQTLTGFVCQGLYDRNKAINYPIQGTAFQWLLWVAIELNRWLKKNGMRSLVTFQIHDSLFVDAHRSEVQAILDKIDELVKLGLPAKWKWINVPLAVESFVCERNWFEKEEYVKRDGRWVPKNPAT